MILDFNYCLILPELFPKLIEIGSFNHVTLDTHVFVQQILVEYLP